ncbi:hypothetical protein RhiirA5_507356 [Rhizophagus irregularis]|uniref:Uncharacterized protein n=1 Tax=Rhizophagus irregularis TaxID=588596 RepID=A0A2N0NKX9_9GLOM|nr:hypothetical protein RhiirA5_507356 [Rhizophagus irregularis]GET62003.1 hypothetical protein RIR_jg12146.t1 [Rhizophagus irregularis DAOM 181602=DAOM 197198]
MSSRITNPSFQSLPVHVFVESLMKLLDVMEKVYNEVLKELGNPLYFVIPFLSYLPRPEALKKMTKLNNPIKNFYPNISIISPCLP